LPHAFPHSFPTRRSSDLSGLAGFESSTPFGYFAPAGTSPEIVGRLHKEVVQALRAPGIKERLFGIGMEIVADTPQQFAAMIKAEDRKSTRLNSSHLGISY